MGVIGLNEHQNDLEKLQKAALLIEEMSMGRLKVCPSTVGHVYIRPESDAYIGLQMQITPESTPGRYAVTFTAFPRRMGLELDASGLRRLMTEVNQSYALLTALEMQKYHPTQSELEQFRESMIEQQEPEQPLPFLNPKL